MTVRTAASVRAGTANPIIDLDPREVQAEWQRRGLDKQSDEELLTACAEILRVPHREPSDSFGLHAPLELMARAALLQRVPPDRREPPRQRLVAIAATWRSSGTPVDVATSPHISTPLPALTDALVVGDLDGIDTAANALTETVTPAELVDQLADTVLPLLGAAGHAGIFLDHLNRFRPRSRAAVQMARPLLREVAREPEWRIEWIDHRSMTDDRSGTLTAALLRPPSPGDLDNDFIYPMVNIVDRSGLAAELLDGPTGQLSVRAARTQLLRVAAWSMLQDDPASAPYGWTHCLTLPQATLDLAPRTRDPARAVAIAATYVLAFRATQGRATLDPTWVPVRPRVHETDAFLADGAEQAAARMWHSNVEQRRTLVRDLVLYSSAHHDAHLAKYTQACLDATVDDPSAGPLFLAAAAHLAGWWHSRPDDNEDAVTVAGDHPLDQPGN